MRPLSNGRPGHWNGLKILHEHASNYVYLHISVDSDFHHSGTARQCWMSKWWGRWQTTLGFQGRLRLVTIAPRSDDLGCAMHICRLRDCCSGSTTIWQQPILSCCLEDRSRSLRSWAGHWKFESIANNQNDDPVILIVLYQAGKEWHLLPCPLPDLISNSTGADSTPLRSVLGELQVSY